MSDHLNTLKLLCQSHMQFTILATAQLTMRADITVVEEPSMYLWDINSAYNIIAVKVS